MKIKVNDTLPLPINEYLKPSASQTTSPAENSESTQMIQPEPSKNDEFSIKNLRLQQAREFLYVHITGKLDGQLLNNTRNTQGYSPTIENEQSLQKQLESATIQSVIQNPNIVRSEQLANILDEGFKEVTDILKISNSLPETLQNEFTRLHYSLSDFITRLNQLAANGIKPDVINVENTKSSSIQIETRKGENISISVAQSFNQQHKSLELYQQLQNSVERSEQHPTGKILDKLLNDYTV